MLATSRAFARIGTAYHKKGELKLALQYYNKSLSESRDQDVVKKAAEVGCFPWYTRCIDYKFIPT